MKVTYLGHAGFIFEDAKKLVIDPFLTGNPATPFTLDSIAGADVVLVTHSHLDHLGDAYAIVKKTGALLVCCHDLAVSGEVTGEGMNYGGTIDACGIPITMVKAEHTVDIGDASGFVWRQGGKVIYHMGDTGLFSDMKLIGELYQPEILLVPMGDRYTMDPRTAAMATSWIKPKVVIPMHYRTFPFLVQDASEFKKMCESACDSKVVILEPGQSTEM